MVKAQEAFCFQNGVAHAHFWSRTPCSRPTRSSSSSPLPSSTFSAALRGASGRFAAALPATCGITTLDERKGEPRSRCAPEGDYALEEAGGPAELAAHLRSPGPHVRGCF